ncbi:MULTISPECIES: ABC transporter ATP-binding protein [unclassified Amycolatopsis]|uniref:ABC transporter ATP-binding protein n=1 Tax=unclassified Amycolatopsis TaxID=2618356 RepID=UPI002876D8DA|nr:MULTISPECIES: ABC transporter ATP-binding protein [unclassified Amycolatopsis]MDS0133355.1 ABC transporter ATP-binding protein [Amycolatopsis sp. 505]MDS0146585.1 ABC transporter ATP-binding protein [Amycolatopsis sp. CM201R]
MTTAVNVRGLRKQYPGHLAVAGLDLDIAQGEVFALLGPNGAGKTTTVEILEGHRRRTAGEVTVLGEDPGQAGRAWRARLGIVLQTATDAAELSVAETVRHFAKYYPDPRDPDEVIEKVGLTEKAGARVKALSGGQRRRVDVALGIIGRPELLFLDEPTTGFDPEARRQFWTLISDLAAEGTTILLTTHYLDEAEALAGRVAVIARGEIVAQDTPQNLGGRAAAEATVRWVDERGEHVERTVYPTKLVTELSAGGRELAGLTVTRPSLEDIYLDLIGDKA